MPTRGLLLALLIGAWSVVGESTSLDAASNDVRVLDPGSGGDVGRDTSLALDGSGNPVVSYVDSTESKLRVVHCGNPTCSSGNVITTLGLAGGTGTSLVLDASGNPVIAYNADYQLGLIHCGNPNCSAGNSVTTVGGLVDRMSLALDSAGNPVVAYNGFSSDLNVLHCGNPTCTSGNVTATPDSAGDVGNQPSIAIDGSGNPVVSYYDDTNQDLKVLHCGNADCTSGNSITSPDTSGDVGAMSSLKLDGSGNPVVSYAGSSGLGVLHCGDPNCSSGNSITAPAPGEGAAWTFLALDASGMPVVSFFGGTTTEPERQSEGRVLFGPDMQGHLS